MASLRTMLRVRNVCFLKRFVNVRARLLSQAHAINQDVEPENNKIRKKEKHFAELAEYRFIYPEFLPDPRFEKRHKIKEKLERYDMMQRRNVINIPEFYVGSVLAVTTADPYAPGKENRFVGICIFRTYNALRATFTLRNVIDNQGVEIMYEMYNPTILLIEVLKLEKRLDDHLIYLRDALPEYSTFPEDMESEYRNEGEPVPINPLKVKLKPRPWYARWERFNLKGVEKIDLPEKFFKRARELATPWEDYDLMKEYRCCIPEEDQQEIWQDVDENISKFKVKKISL